MGIYQNFRTVNSKKINSYTDTNRVGDTFKILSTLQDRQDKAVAKRDEVSAVLENVPVADQDRPAWEKAKAEYKKQLATVPESTYIGDMDRQITKIARKAQKGVQEVTGNYMARQKYIEEGKKLGLDDERLQKHLVLSNTQGGLQYDPSTGDFKNRFSGIGFTKAPDTDRVRKVLELMKPTKRKVIQGDRVIETEVFDPSSLENLAIFKNFYDYDPELQKELQFQNAYTKIKADKFDYNSLGEEGKKVANKMMLDNGTYNPQEAYFKQGTTENAQKVFGLITSNALLKYQNDYKEDLSDAGKEKLKFGYDMAKTKFIQDQENYRALLKIKADQEKEDKKAKKEEDIIQSVTPAFSPYPNLTDENGKLKERSVFDKAIDVTKDYIQSQFENRTETSRRRTKEGKSGDYNFGELGYNAMRANYKGFEATHKMIESGKDENGKKLSRERLEELQEFQQKQIKLHEKNIKGMLEDQTLQQLPLEVKIGKKPFEENQAVLEQLFGKTLNGGVATHWRAKEITPGKVTAPNEFKTFTDDLDIDWSKELRKSFKEDGSSLITLDGITGSDGDFTKSLAITYHDPEDSKNERKFLVEIPGQKSGRLTTKGGIVDINKVIQAKNNFISEGGYQDSKGNKRPVEYKHEKGNGQSTIHIIDKETGKELDTLYLNGNNQITNKK